MEGKNELAIKLDNEIATIVGSDRLGGFQDAYVLAISVEKLKEMLTPEFMKPIMLLQNNQLGFKTDKKEGYSEAIVKEALIVSTLIGVQPTGNQFNIIAGNSYITKEGFGYLLKKTKGLKYEIIPGVPVIDMSKKQGTVEMNLWWKLGDQPEEKRVLPIVVKVNEYMGADAIIGKATRKTRCWLFNKINDVEIADADIEDIQAEVTDYKEEQYDWGALQKEFDAKKHLFGPQKQASGKRILDAKEKTGYLKLKDELAKVKVD